MVNFCSSPLRQRAAVFLLNKPQTNMKKILLNFRTWLIHKLGGLTIKESQQSDNNSYNIGYFIACRNHLDFADSLYGRPSEEWSKQMYDRLKSDYKQWEHNN